MKNLLVPVLFLSLSLGYAQSKEIPITEISQKDKNSGILIDVRTAEEYEAGHLEDAVNIDWFDPGFAEKMKGLDVAKNEPVYLYCKKGGRSAKAARLLDSLGYRNVVDLLGGYDAWENRESQ